MAATLSGRPAKTEPRYHDAGRRLPAAGDRLWRRVQSDAAPINDLGRRVRNARYNCAATRAQDQTRLAPRLRMAWANPHGLRHRRRLRVPGQDLPFADQDRARHHRRPMVRAPILRADETGGDGKSDARPSPDRRADGIGERRWLSPVKTIPQRAPGSAAPSTPASLRRKALSRSSIRWMRSVKPARPTSRARSTRVGSLSPEADVRTTIDTARLKGAN